MTTRTMNPIMTPTIIPTRLAIAFARSVTKQKKVNRYIYNAIKVKQTYNHNCLSFHHFGFHHYHNLDVDNIRIKMATKCVLLTYCIGQ